MPACIRRVAVEPYHVRLPRLRREAGLSQTTLFREVRGVSLDTIRALERDPTVRSPRGRGRARYPSAATLAALAPPLGVEPEEFPEYRLARARELLDERAVGLERALATLERIEAKLGG
jgi:transcriptional regulator with XRE-family HTH domain